MVNKLKSRIPYLGNNQALKNHIANALRNAGDLNVVIKNIDAIPKENMDSLTKTGLEKSKNEIIPEIRQIIKETQGETAEQGSKLEQAGVKQEAVKGEGWTMRDGGSAKQYARHKFEVEKWINDLSGVLSDEWAANLKTLALKHPEMFKSEADVFRVIKEIKDNPTHFFKNNIDENALMVKHLDDKKVGEIGVRKSDGQIVHVTKNNKDKRIKELERRQDKLLGNTELEKATGRRASTDTPVESRTMATANKAGSVANVKRQTAGTSTLPTPLSAADKTALKQDANSAGEAYSSATERIIPQNSADRLVEKIIELDDAGEIGNMLRKTIISKDISTKTKLAAINAAKRRLVAITAKNTQKDDKKQK